MKHQLETERLYFREFIASDDKYMFEMDSDPHVHTYLWDPVVKDITESQKVIERVRRQYTDIGFGRMATFLKANDEFIGWAGLKLESNVNGRHKFYDIGYRLMQKHWGNGYATEANRYFVAYGFDVMRLETINAFAYTTNAASRKVLEKSGLTHTEDFTFEGIEAAWYEINYVDYNLKSKS